MIPEGIWQGRGSEEGEVGLGKFNFELGVQVIKVAVWEGQRKQNDQSPWK